MFSSVQSLNHVWLLLPHGLQQARLPCPSPIPGVYWNSCPLSQWCHPTIPSSVIPFSSCLQSFSAPGSFQMSQFFKSSGQNTGVSASASALPMNIKDWFPLGLTDLILLLSKGLSSVFTLFKHWIGQNVLLGFSVKRYEKCKWIFLPNQYFSNLSKSDLIFWPKDLEEKLFFILKV